MGTNFELGILTSVSYGSNEVVKRVFNLALNRPWYKIRRLTAPFSRMINRSDYEEVIAPGGGDT